MKIADLKDQLFSQYSPVESSQTKKWGPHFQYDYFGGHGLKSLGTLALRYTQSSQPCESHMVSRWAKQLADRAISAGSPWVPPGLAKWGL